MVDCGFVDMCISAKKERETVMITHILAEEQRLEQELLEKISRSEKIWSQAEMPTEFRDALIGLLLIQESCEYRGGENYLRYCPQLAPTAEKAAFIAHIGIEELGHAAQVQRILTSLGVRVKHSCHLYQEKHILRIFQHPELFTSWSHVLIFNYLMDGAAGQQLAEFKNGPYGPWTLMIEAIEEEEMGHVEHGTKGIEEWANSQRGLAELQEALDDWWPLVMDVFGAPDASSKRTALYRKYNLKQMSNDEARSMFFRSVQPLLTRLGLAVESPCNLSRAYYAPNFNRTEGDCILLI